MATITLDKTTIKAGETAVVTFTVDISHMMGVTNRGGVRTVNDVTITGGTISAGYDFRYVAALSTPTTRVYQGTFTPTANLDRTECTISYNPSGTDNDATSAVFIVDTRAPTLTGTPTIGNPNLTRANQVTTISFVFSEQLNQASFTTADLTIPAGMGTLENLRTTDGGRSWQVDLRASANTEAKDLQIGINMAGITDVAGNPGTGNVNLVIYHIDTKPPSATITVTPNPVTSSNDRLVTVTITFDEAVTGFTADNIDFSNAHVTPYGSNRIGTLNRSADGRTYTITYTASPDTEDATNTVTLRNLDTIRDAAGNAVTVNPTSNNFEIDTQAPRVDSIAFDKAHLTAGDTATITVTFNESISGLTEAAFEIANGSVSNLRQDTTDGRIWRATFTPTANLARTSFDRLAVRLDGLTDRVGNSSSGIAVRQNPTPIVIDTKVFVVNAATVNGKQLVLQYSDETRLDPDQTHNAPNDAFVVLVDGVRNSVTGVAVDATAKTVTLTLERAVSKDQQVSVAYNDPSTGDDPQAVQEATTGKDAASFAAKPVTNLTPPPPPPPHRCAGRTGCTGLGPRRPVQRPRGPGHRPAAPRWLGRPVW
nr:Ig-like domain-containing protein [Verminephrobacter eiseniae]